MAKTITMTSETKRNIGIAAILLVLLGLDIKLRK